jgi:hypothetical protein
MDWGRTFASRVDERRFSRKAMLDTMSLRITPAHPNRSNDTSKKINKKGI